jgi:hypothetical protein
MQSPNLAKELSMTVGQATINDNNPLLEDQLDAKSERYYYAKQWQLIWWRFQRHRLAMFSLIGLIIFYLIAIFPGFAAPYDPQTRFEKMQQSPPIKIHILDENGGFHRPFIYGQKRELDQKTYITDDTSVLYRSVFLLKVMNTKFWGSEVKSSSVWGRSEAPPLMIFGTDELERHSPHLLPDLLVDWFGRCHSELCSGDFAGRFVHYLAALSMRSFSASSILCFQF